MPGPVDPLWAPHNGATRSGHYRRIRDMTTTHEELAKRHIEWATAHESTRSELVAVENNLDAQLALLKANGDELRELAVELDAADDPDTRHELEISRSSAQAWADQLRDGIRKLTAVRDRLRVELDRLAVIDRQLDRDALDLARSMKRHPAGKKREQ